MLSAQRHRAEGIFGPVLTATPFTDEDEAVGLANDSDYGWRDTCRQPTLDVRIDR